MFRIFCIFAKKHRKSNISRFGRRALHIGSVGSPFTLIITCCVEGLSHSVPERSVKFYTKGGGRMVLCSHPPACLFVQDPGTET